MEEQVILAFDVGGTFIKAGAVGPGFAVIEHTVAEYESKSNGTEDEILNHFIAIIKELIGKVNGGTEIRKTIQGIGFAFPGPFDYDRGISYIRGLNKFEALYNVPIGQRLRSMIRNDPMLSMAIDSNSPVVFENDAALFALGEAADGGAAKAERAVCLTIGTGLGSAFLEHGRLVKHRPDVPEQGWLYDMPYRDGIADDYVSRRGILNLAGSMGIGTGNGRDVKELAAAAFAGDDKARELFRRFGAQMGDILAEPLRKFQPEVVVLGGQIAKSSALFVPAFTEKLREQGVSVKAEVSGNTLYSSFKGIYHLCLQKLSRS